MPDLNNWPVPRLLSTAARLVEHDWNKRLAELNLTHAGVTVLEVLADEGEMTQSQLALRVRVQTQTMGKTLSRLETNRHIVRVPNQMDRRRHRVTITKEGHQALQESARLEQWLTSDDGDQITDVSGMLTSIIRNLGKNRFGVVDAREN